MKPENLIAHPEGGRFQEVYRSAQKVAVVSAGKDTVRAALTHIYFSLGRGQVSRFHRVLSDEVWNLYRGEGLYLYTWNGKDASIIRTTLSSAANYFCTVVPAGIWQAAEPISGEVLVGCSVAPGFEFKDFTLIDPESMEALSILDADPDLARFISS